jgi:hypothetical protein
MLKLSCLKYRYFLEIKEPRQKSEQKNRLFIVKDIKLCFFSFLVAFLLPFWTTYDINEINIQNHFRMSIDWHFKKNIYIQAVDIGLWNTQIFLYAYVFYQWMNL